MKAIVSEGGIRFKGVMGFVSVSPEGTFKALLDRLGAQTQQSGERAYKESVDEMVVRYTIPLAEAVSILQEFGIEVHLAEGRMP
jgi:hypothetical protein